MKKYSMILFAAGTLVCSAFYPATLSAQTPSSEKQNAKELEEKRQELIRNAYAEADTAIRGKQYKQAMDAYMKVVKNLKDNDAFGHFMRFANTIRRVEGKEWNVQAQDFYRKAYEKAANPSQKTNALIGLASLQEKEIAEKTLQEILDGSNYDNKDRINALLAIAERENDVLHFEKLSRKALPLAENNSQLLYTIYERMIGRNWHNNRKHARELVEEALKNPAIQGAQKAGLNWRLVDLTDKKEDKKILLKQYLSDKDSTDIQKQEGFNRLADLALSSTEYMGTVSPEAYREALAFAVEVQKLKGADQRKNQGRMAKLYLDLNELENAETCAQNILKTDKLPDQERVAMLVILGDISRKRNLPEQAVKFYRDAAEKNARNILLLEKLAKTEMENRNYPAVLEVLERMKNLPGRYENRKQLDAYIANVKERMKK